MGNCQAVDAAAMVIQHPNGKIDRMYWPMNATEVMKMNPGYYVSLIIPLPPPSPPFSGDKQENNKTIRFTRVHLLRPTDTLILGRAYRLIPSQEVKKFLRAKKQAKMKLQESDEAAGIIRSINESNREEILRPAAAPNAAVRRSRSWRPSLQSISESSTSTPTRMEEGDNHGFTEF